MQFYRLIPIFIVLLLIAALQTPGADAANQPEALKSAQQQITAAFARLDSSLKKAAGEVGKSGLAGDAARKVLSTTCGELSYSVDCCTIDLQGRIITVEPAQYRQVEGKDISDQKQVQQILTLHKPILSAVFRSVEGYDAVDAEYPVFNPEGSFIGSISILFKPEMFLGEIIKPIVKGMPVDIWAMEQGGRILYDVDPSQIGLNLFTAPLYQSYKQLVQLGKEIAKTPQGEGDYRFKKANSSGPDVNKKAYWQSVVLFGSAWRLVGIHLEQEAKAEAGRPASAASAEQALEQFTIETALQAALAADNQDESMKLFKKFYEATPGIYSIQWIDTKGINRCGYPFENSLSAYDYNSGRAASDKEVLQILKQQKPAVLEAPLFEGRTGSFIFRPVFKDGQYLGMVYSIKLIN